MHIKKVNIKDYKCFEGKFSIEFSKGVNILVGDNETGKSTILEATNLALTGILNGRYLRNEVSEYLFNRNTVRRYLEEVNSGMNPALPQVVIEVFFEGTDLPLFEGNGNSEKVKHCGVTLKIEFDPEYQSLYEALVSSGDKLETIPIEYYQVTWKSCARQSVTARVIPLKSVLIDSASARYQNGSDVYISRIIRNELDDDDKVHLSQAHRKMKEQFMTNEAVKKINKDIKKKSKVTDKDLHISVDLASQHAWEASLMTYLDEIPFHQIGKGEQCIVKTNLALAHKKAREANVILLEEPENHLSHSMLNKLLSGIADNCEEKQAIISTHSSFVANKLGLEHLLLLSNQKVSRLSDLSKDTFNFFKKLPGYQTLRLLLCRKAILVEGDSDELIVQKAYMEKHNGRLPIQDGIDVISVKLTFKRFLEIAEKIEHPVAVVTDNDKDFEKKVEKKYSDYEEVSCVSIFADKRNDLRTLEPQFVDANTSNLKRLRKVIGISDARYDTAEKVAEYMEGHKTEWALKVFESEESLCYPQYIRDAVSWCNEQQ